MALAVSTSAMDTDETYVSVASTPGRERKFDPKVKERAYKYLFGLVESIMHAANLQFSEALFYDLDFSGRLEGAVSTLHNQLRKEASGNAMDSTKFATLTAQLSGVHQANMGIAYTYFTTNVKPNLNIDYMTICPILNMLTSFKLVKDEVRIGVTQIIPRKGMKNKTVSVGTYGLSAQHAPYLKLVTLKPERRSGLMMCIGPLAHCISLLEDKQYTQKSSRALKEELKHLPMTDAIIECCVRNNRSSIGGVLSSLGDLLLLTTDRTHCKMTPPLTTFLNAYYPRGVSDANDQARLKRAVDDFDFSGKGAVMFYRDNIQEKKFTWLSDSQVGALSSQVMFHSCFGTHMEDLGVLGQITNVQDWAQRKQLSEVFTKKRGQSVEFTAVKLELASKLISACGTKMLNNVKPMVQCKPAFSGKRKRCFSEELKAVLQGSTTGAFDSSPLSLTRALTDTKREILQNNLTEEFGTTEWYGVTGITRDDWGVTSDREIRESGKYFYA